MTVQVVCELAKWRIAIVPARPTQGAVGVRNLLDNGHFEDGTLFLNNAEVPRMVFAEVRMVFAEVRMTLQ